MKNFTIGKIKLILSSMIFIYLFLLPATGFAGFVKGFDPVTKSEKAQSSGSFSGTIFTPTIKKPIKISANIFDINEHVGKQVSLKARIDQITLSSNGNIYLNVGGEFPNQKLSLVIFQDDTHLFTDITRLENELVEVNGKLLLYKNRPQIILKNSSQIQLQKFHSQPNKAVTSLDNVTDYIGKEVTLMVKVHQIVLPSNGNIYLNVGGKFPDQKLSLIIFQNKKNQFPNITKIEGKLIKITGKVTEFKNNPQIIINDPKQIIEL